MRSAIAFILIFISISINAQTITFLEKGSATPIEGVVAQISFNGKEEILISNNEGQITSELIQPGSLIITQHLSFISKEIQFEGDANIYLESNQITLDEVVISTGQFQPQSLKNSVYQVKTISQKDITSMGAINLEEALQTNINSVISYDPAIGNYSIGLQGLSSQNTKILLDGVPIAGRNGNGNDVDLSQIDLQQIERIEIVEGPMAVNYGANALAGVVNLISKKSNESSISASIQEESVGSEYGLSSGRHIQRLAISQTFLNRLTTRMNISRNDFQGFNGDSTSRTYEWDPKMLWTANGLLRYNGKNHSIHYKLDWNNNLLSSPGIERDNIQPSTGVNRPYAFDETYDSRRWMHQIQSEGNISEKHRYSFVYSYSDFERIKRGFSKDLTSGTETLTIGSGDQDTSAFNAHLLRVISSGNLFSSVQYQLGFELSNESASGGRIQDGSQKLTEYSYFGSLEFVSGILKLRPGIRASYNQQYGNSLLPSLNAKVSLPYQVTLRGSYGRGYRTPTLRELYFEFVDSNHRIFGNPNLSPESSNHFNAYLDKNFNSSINLSLGAFFNDIDKQITTAQSETDITATSYANILKFKTLGYNASIGYQKSGLSVKTGISYIGRYNRISEEDSLNLDQFFYALELTGNVSYEFSKPGINMALSYKYTGPQQNYIQSDENISIAETDDFHWMNLTCSKRFGNNLTVQTGIKNLMDVTTISTGGSTGGVHSSGPNRLIAYGRSYFFNLTYQLNFKTNQ